MLLHPTVAALSRYADQDCTDREERRIKRHLEKCARCRSEVSFFREITAGIQNLPPPRPPTELWDAIVERFDAGEMVLLPGTGGVPHFEPPPVSRGRTVLVGALSVLVAMLVWGSWDGAVAGGTSLTSNPLPDASGSYVESLDISFHTASSMASLDSIRVRAEVFEEQTNEAHGARIVDAVFERTGPGTFSGRLRMPGRAVFGRLAVEDLAGDRVETGEGGDWEFLALDADGVPTRDALRQRFSALHQHPDESRATVDLYLELYPDDPVVWYYRFVQEEPQPTGPALEPYERQFLTLHEHLAASHDLTDVERAAAMYRLAEIVGRPTHAAHWLGTLRERWPEHPTTARMAAVAALRRFAPGSDDLLAEYERLWAAGFTEGSIARRAARLAATLHRPEDVEQWIGRFLADHPGHAHAVLSTLEEVPALHPILLHQIDLILAGMDRDPGLAGLERSIYESPYRFRRRLEERRAELLTSRGTLRLAKGDAVSGAADLARAAEIGWRAERFRLLGTTLLDQNDTLGALEMFANEAADPLAESNPFVERFIGSDIGRGYFQRLVDDARAQRETRLQTELEDRPVDLDLTVLRPDGTSVALRSVLKGTPSILAFFAFEPNVRANAGELLDLRARFAHLPLNWLVVSRPERNTRRLAMKQDLLPGIEFVIDPTRRVGHALDVWETTHFAVIDSTGRLRWTGNNLEDALRIAALSSLAPPTGASLPD